MSLALTFGATQERFRTLTSSYYRGAHGIILVYDISRKSTFEHLDNWLREIEMYTNNKAAVKLLVGNKVDLEEEGGRAVPREDAESFARAHQMIYIETSAKEKTGVQQTFEELVRKVMDTGMLQAETPAPSTRRLSSAGSDSAQGGCAC